MTFMGGYTAGATYGTGDAVEYNGNSYISVTGSNSNNTPDDGATGGSTPWALLAKRGATGAAASASTFGSTGIAASGTFTVTSTASAGQMIMMNDNSVVIMDNTFDGTTRLWQFQNRSTGGGSTEKIVFRNGDNVNGSVLSGDRSYAMTKNSHYWVYQLSWDGTNATWLVWATGALGAPASAYP